jgi:hypothetical protein
MRIGLEFRVVLARKEVRVDRTCIAGRYNQATASKLSVLEHRRGEGRGGEEG